MTSHPRRLAIVALVAAALVPACADDRSDDTDGGQGTDGAPPCRSSSAPARSSSTG